MIKFIKKIINELSNSFFEINEYVKEICKHILKILESTNKLIYKLETNEQDKILNQKIDKLIDKFSELILSNKKITTDNVLINNHLIIIDNPYIEVYKEKKYLVAGGKILYNKNYSVFCDQKNDYKDTSTTKYYELSIDIADFSIDYADLLQEFKDILIDSLEPVYYSEKSNFANRNLLEDIKNKSVVNLKYID